MSVKWRHKVGTKLSHMKSPSSVILASFLFKISKFIHCGYYCSLYQYCKKLQFIFTKWNFTACLSTSHAYRITGTAEWTSGICTGSKAREAVMRALAAFINIWNNEYKLKLLLRVTLHRELVLVVVVVVVVVATACQKKGYEPRTGSITRMNTTVDPARQVTHIVLTLDIKSVFQGHICWNARGMNYQV